MAKAQAIALVANEVPAHVINAGIGRGNEDVGNALAIPRIKLLQKMSPEVDKYSPKYVEGAEPGAFINSITGEVYGDELYALNLKFKIEYVVWRNLDIGGGLLGNFTSQAEAEAAVAAQEKPSDYEIKDTHTHVLLLKNPTTGEVSSPVLMDFTVSKLRTSRAWNTQIATKGGDRFASLWKLKSIPVESRTGQQFMNLDVECLGWTTEEDYKVAEELYEQFSA
jgi:hypothetical protein